LYRLPIAAMPVPQLFVWPTSGHCLMTNSLATDDTSHSILDDLADEEETADVYKLGWGNAIPVVDHAEGMYRQSKTARGAAHK